MALVGDFNESVLAHRLIPRALELAASNNEFMVDAVWVSTTELSDLNRISSFHGIWCAPGSPYHNRMAVLDVIRYARETGKPYLGTCGGCQHAILEFAQNVLDLKNTGLEEEDPSVEIPLISSLSCRLTDENRKISLQKGSRIHNLVGRDEILEEYRCGFGINPRYLNLFENSELRFVGFDDNVPQAFELRSHSFFVGTAFQPERSARRDVAHPLIEAFLRAMAHPTPVLEIRKSAPDDVLSR